MKSDKKIKILLVEDDSSFGSVLRDYLILNDYEVILAMDGEDGLETFKRDEFDLAILDVMMPKKDGFELAREIKDIRPKMPIIFLTARSMKEDVLKGYRVGAQDYITKPFDTEVLLYKIKVVLQRNVISDEKLNQKEFEIGEIHFNSRLRQLKIGEQSYKLSPKENELLRLLCIYKDDFLPRKLALNKIWHEENYFTSRSMDVYIAKLRSYLKADPSVEISNIHGEGFRLIVSPQE